MTEEEKKDQEYMELLQRQWNINRVFKNLTKQHETALELIDELKEKAEKWDDLQRSIKYGPGNLIKLWEDNKKLEAIKTLCEPEADKGVLSTRGRKKLAIDILKILEGEK